MTRKQPKPKTPKPVEAWAPASANGIDYYHVRSTKEDAFLYCIDDEKPIRVRIVPIVKRKPRTKRKERKK